MQLFGDKHITILSPIGCRLEQLQLEKASALERALATDEAETLNQTQLNELTIQQIRKLAKTKGVSAKGRRTEIAERLQGLVDSGDIATKCTEKPYRVVGHQCGGSGGDGTPVV